MDKTAHIIDEINSLDLKELEKVYHEILKKININKINFLENALNKFCGKGKGIWTDDAQDFINQIRLNERF